MRLRDYQESAVSSALDSIEHERNPVISLPTGSGKSLVAAAICVRRSGRTLVLSHRKELLLQDMYALNRYDVGIDTGIYCAGLNRRETSERVIFAGVASAHRRMPELGSFGTVIIDEAHLIAPQDEGVMYNSCLSFLNGVPRVGLTATPYRLDSGMLHEGEGAWFNDLAIHIKPSELVEQGYLVPLVGIGTLSRTPTEGAHVRGGEFVASDLSQLSTDEIVESAVTEMLSLSAGAQRNRNHGMVFCIDISHAEQVHRILSEKGEDARVITGKTPSDERARTIEAFKDGGIRWLLNVNVLTTGFDAPLVDCLVILRPTMSKGLHVQMMGRGMRLAPEKENCLVLDFAGNVARHGSLDMLAQFVERKTEEQREKDVETQRARERQITHALRAGIGDPMNGGGNVMEVKVTKCQYRLTVSKKFPGLRNVRVEYHTDIGMVRQWLCVEYTRGARWHAEQWFKRRGVSAPRLATQAVDLARRLPNPKSLTVSLGRWTDVLIEHFNGEGETGKEDMA